MHNAHNKLNCQVALCKTFLSVSLFPNTSSSRPSFTEPWGWWWSLCWATCHWSERCQSSSSRSRWVVFKETVSYLANDFIGTSQVFLTTAESRFWHGVSNTKFTVTVNILRGSSCVPSSSSVVIVAFLLSNCRLPSFLSQQTRSFKLGLDCSGSGHSLCPTLRW